VYIAVVVVICGSKVHGEQRILVTNESWVGSCNQGLDLKTLVGWGLVSQANNSMKHGNPTKEACCTSIKKPTESADSCCSVLAVLR
jgi:hypothetical protein